MLMTRAPVPGAVKTRLIPALGAAGAAALHREMTAHALAWARAALAGLPGDLEVRFTGGSVEDMRNCFGPVHRYIPQGGGDLGARMLQAFEAAACEGVERTVVIGSDCPALDADRMRQAFYRLANDDVVLGPANDGGYYLIGLRAPEPRLFTGIDWGSATVLDETLTRARAANLQVALLDVLTDVDEPADLAAWRAQRRSRPALANDVAISIVIPTLQENQRIGPLLERLTALTSAEIIVVDGGSRDSTVHTAQERGVKVVNSAAGRARQMNAGAAEAHGDLLLFLHADTSMPETFIADIRGAMRDPRVVAGAFLFALDAAERRFRLLESLVNWRSRRLRLPYGDQALFVRADVFRGLGGFPDVAVMEDFALVRRLKRRGRAVLTNTRATTSARLWRKSGFVRVTLVNQLTILAHLTGVPADRLAGWRQRLLDRQPPDARTHRSGNRLV